MLFLCGPNEAALGWHSLIFVNGYREPTAWRQAICTKRRSWLLLYLASAAHR
jgi:hypothetical protein